MKSPGGTRRRGEKGGHRGVEGEEDRGGADAQGEPSMVDNLAPLIFMQVGAVV
jgi:hypothetical protein